ncbi:MAG: winged helix-turn-helix domain-containing protein [Candidatus Nitrosopumilus sp. bin_7KS]
MYDSYHAQKSTRDKNKAVILDALKDSPQRFTELLKISGLSPAGITKLLLDMVKEDLIHKESDKRYSVTNTGKKILQSADISYITNRIRNEGGTYHPRYSGVKEVLKNFRLNDAIYPFLYVDKNLDSEILSTSYVEKIQEMILEKIKKSIEKEKKKDKFSGQMVLGFVIDYTEAKDLLKPTEKKQR